MAIKSMEELEKSLMTKLDSIAPDIEKSCLEKVRTETKELVSQMRADLAKTRDVSTQVSDTKAHWKNVEAFFNMPKLDSAMVDLTKTYSEYDPEKTKKLTPDYIKGMSGFAKAVYMREHGMTLPDEIMKALGETQGSTGGFFVPIEFRAELLMLTVEDQVVRPRATVIPMATDLLRIPRIHETTRSGGIVYGGMTGTFGPEAGSLGTGDPTAGQVELKAKKFSEYILVSNELVMDSPIAISPLLGFMGRKALGFREDYNMFWGTGANNVAGLLTSTATNPALISLTRDTTGTITYQDVKTMYARMLPASINNAVWIASPSVFPALCDMAVSVGAAGSAVWISNVNTAVGAPPATIFGRPVIFSEKMSQLGTAGDICFMDLSYYLIGDRMQFALTTSEHVAFATDQIAFRMIERLDGAPWINSALTPAKQTDTLSPFVAVAT